MYKCMMSFFFRKAVKYHLFFQMLHDLGLETDVTTWDDALKQCGHLLRRIQASNYSFEPWVDLGGSVIRYCYFGLEKDKCDLKQTKRK